ncbi:hypothetical protein DW860_10610 [Dorea formicigenerans]|uniref:Uncharacterized protein n=1 Tax=Dorea formicigenerans TaxID=39486 RepID=A0A413YJ38_9FIRM|nr:hypothetical protein DW860_10610 [Dorea formicigenerans]RHC21622.1 hypothetical protein DW854_07595 [Dorea formicigenerans]RHN16781.1 hypothetical protein DWZ24_06770 [Dorea formicigenerans]
MLPFQVYHIRHLLFHFSSRFQECLGILAARCASCNCMTYFYCAPLQSCRRLYQLEDDSHH